MAEEYKNPDTGQEEMKDTAQIPVEDQKAEEEIQAEDKQILCRKLRRDPGRHD